MAVHIKTIILKDMFMKNIIVFLAIIFFVKADSLFAQTFNIKWGNPHSSFDYYEGSAETNEGNILQLQINIKASSIIANFAKFKIGATLSLITHDFEKITTKEYEADEANTSIISLSKLGKNIYLFYRVYDKEKKFTSFFADKIDQTTLRITEKVRLGSFQSFSENNQATIRFTESTNKTKISAFIISSTGTKHEYKSSVFIYDTDLKVLWTKEVNSNNSKYFNPLGFLVSNNGIVYLSSLLDSEEIKEKNKIKSKSYKYEVITLSEKDDKRTNVNVSGVYLDSHYLLLDKKEETLTLLGFYQNLDSKNRAGIWYSKIEIKDYAISNTVFSEFEKELITILDKDGFARDNKTNYGLDPLYQIVYIGERPNGSIDITSEYRLKNAGVTTFKSGGSYYTALYYYGTIINTNISKDGKIVNTRIPKAQGFETAPLVDNNLIGFFPILIGNDLHFLYNDCKPNFEQELSKKVDGINNFQKAILVDAKVDVNGVLTRKIALDINIEKFATAPLKFIKLNENTLSVTGFCTKTFDDRTRFGLIKIN
jgi:hypothetical protein